MLGPRQGEQCACCGLSTGRMYAATFYSAHEVSGRCCPWCCQTWMSEGACLRKPGGGPLLNRCPRQDSNLRHPL
ncbi:CbrC family protein [Streptomyces sp. MH60]|uniref:CbrC family protein n=1 Tax=Streptomyces sp. MH60 TaxID=1940758 RepID=UPI00313D4BA0